MPSVSSSSTSQRLLALLSLLQARRDWPARVLSERLGVSERTVRRDIDRLRELDYAIEATRGPDGGYRLGAGTRLPPLLLDDEQAVAVSIALQSAGALGAGIGEAAERALSTLSRTMPSALAHRISRLQVGTAVPAGSGVSEVDPDVLLTVSQAIHESLELRFDYASPRASATTGPRRTEPHHLLLHAGRWYLVGFTADLDEWRVYRVDRISPRSHTGRRFTPRTVPGGDPAAFLSARFKGSAGADTWPCWGEAVLDAPVDAVAAFIGDGIAEPLGDSRCRIRLGSWSWTALAATIGRFDADVEVIGPPELAAAFTRLARRFAAAGGGEQDEGVHTMTPTEVIFIGGRSGAGKTSVAAEASRILAASDVRHAVIEGDNLDQAHPEPWREGIDLAGRNLAAMWRNYRSIGYSRLIFTNTVSVLEVPALTTALGGKVRSFSVVLTATDGSVTERLALREIGTALDEHIERSRAAAARLDDATDAYRIATDGRSVREIAHELLSAAGWGDAM